MIRMLLFGLIVVSAALSAVLSASVGDTNAALGSVAIGAAWLALEWRDVRGLSWLGLLAFVVVAVLDSMNHAPMPLTLLALCSALAAWDLSTFRARTAGVADESARAALERTHLRKLALTAGIGFAAALIPLVAQFSISFLALCVVLLIAVLALNNVVGTLRGKQE